MLANGLTTVGLVARTLGRPALKNAAVMVVYGNGHGALSVLLAHHVLRKLVIDLVRGGNAIDNLLVRRLRLLGGFGGRCLDTKGVHHVGEVIVRGHEVVCQRLFQNLNAGGNTFVANEDVCRAFYQFTHLILTLAAKRAANGAHRILVASRIVWHYSAPFAASLRVPMMRSTMP